MRTFLSRLTAVGSILIASIAVIGCAAMSGPEGGASRTMPSELRVGTATNYPPLAFKADGQMQGVEVDFAQKLTSELGIKVSVIETTWEQLIPALQGGQIDVIMSGMSITEDRAQRVQFTVPYLNIGQMALIRRADYDRLRDRDAMQQPSARVGFINGTTGEAYARKQLSQTQLVGYDMPEAAIVALRGGAIDFFIHDAPSIWRITGSRTGEYADLTGRYRPLTAEYLAWAVRKNDDALLERLNGVLLRWEQTNEIRAVLDRWIPVRKIAIDVEGQ
jgi:polar amino acid transport system substrate-binding protein